MTEPEAPRSEANPAEVEATVAANRADPLATAQRHDAEVLRTMRRMTRRSFAWGAAGAAAGLAGWGWIITRKDDRGIPWPLRRVLEFNERLAAATFAPARLAPTFQLNQAKEPRVNGKIGMRQNFVPAEWKLQVTSDARPAESLNLTLDDIRELPRIEMVTELKCVEGWSQIVHWGGARLSDFASKYRLHERARPTDPVVRYVGLATPGGDYFVGFDLASALHPQTLLCYEMNGKPLTLDHGAPLRLVTTLKYGIKCIKRIGSIHFQAERPADYWAERGYDWYAGH